MNHKTKKQMSLGAVAGGLTIAIQFLSGILYTPIILKTLGQSEYGVYSLCLSFVSYLTIFNSGINAAYTRFYVQTKTTAPEKVDKLNGTFARIFVVLSIIALVGGLILSYHPQLVGGSKFTVAELELIKESFIILAITTAVTTINCIFSSLIVANERFVVGKMVIAVNAVLAPCITIPFLMNGYGSTAILVVKLLLDVAMLIFNAVYCLEYIDVHFDFKKNEKSLLKSIVVFAGFILLQNIMDILNWQIDKLILAKVGDTTDISIYTVGAQFNSYFLSIVSVISGVFIAQINRLVAQKKDRGVSDLFVKMSRVCALLAFYIMMAYIVFGKQFIACWAGEGYEDSYFIGMLIMLPVTVSMTQALGQDIVRAKNVHKWQIVLNLAVCLLNLGISIPLAKEYGALGTAIGTFVSEIVICIIIQGIYYQQVAKLDMKAYFLQMLRMIPGLLLPAVFGFLINQFSFLQYSFASIVLYGIFFTIVYILSMWLLVMNVQEKQMVLQVLNSVKKKIMR